MGSPVESPAAKTYRRLADVTRPSPSEALTFVDERIDTINDASFAMQWDFSENRPEEWRLRDKPNTAHGGHSASLAFADGHVERHRWRDARTMKAPRDDATMPGNRDILRMQRHGTWREDSGE